MIFKTGLLAILASLALSAHADSQLDQWLYDLAEGRIGSYEVNPPAESTAATLTVTPGMHRYQLRIPGCGTNITHARAIIRGAGIQISGAGVRYSDGTQETSSFSGAFAQDYISPWGDLDQIRPSKCPTKVWVNASSDSSTRSATVTIRIRTR